MSSVVFMRGVNVGGHKTFRPSALARQLPTFRVVSIGAAGTFVVGTDVIEREARNAFLKHLGFDAQMMICPADDVIHLVKVQPFADEACSKADGQFISVLESRPRRLPQLPLRVPAGEHWQVAVTAVHGRFVVTLLRRVGRTLLYPNEVVEKCLGVAATTRGWSTILKVHQALEMQRGLAAEGRKSPGNRRRSR